MQPLGQVLKGVISRLGLEKRLKEEQAALVWPKVAGVHVARRTTGVKVKDGVMYVTLTTSAWAHQLSYLKAGLLQKINGELGEPVIKDIRFGSGAARGPGVYVDSQEAPRPPLEVSQHDRELAEEASRAVSDQQLSRLVYALIISARKWRCKVGQSSGQVR